MHELGLCGAVMERVAERAGTRPVARVRVRFGSLLRVHPDAFAQSFALMAAGTVAEGAVAECVDVPARGACRSCGTVFDVRDVASACTRCGSLDVSVVGGDEIVLELLEFRSSPTGAGGETRTPTPEGTGT